MNLTEATIKALNGELNEARSHKEDNERVAPRTSNEKVVGYVKNSPYDEIDVPNRAIYRKGKPNSENGSIWGRYDKDEQSQYENGISQSIQDYKRLKNDAESERHIANYHNALAQQSDDEASDIVRDKKLYRAKKSLQGKQIFKTENSNKKTESTDDYKEGSELRIEFWETESDRNQGYGEIYKYYPESQKQEAIKDAKKLIRREGYACVEVYNTKTERTEFWTDGNEVNYYGNKIEEKLLKEDAYLDKLLVYIHNEDDLDAVKNWLTDLYNLTSDVEDRYYDMDEGVRYAIDNMFNDNTTPSHCIRWLLSAIKDVEAELEFVNLDENN